MVVMVVMVELVELRECKWQRHREGMILATAVSDCSQACEYPVATPAQRHGSCGLLRKGLIRDECGTSSNTSAKVLFSRPDAGAELQRQRGGIVSAKTLQQTEASAQSLSQRQRRGIVSATTLGAKNDHNASAVAWFLRRP